MANFGEVDNHEEKAITMFNEDQKELAKEKEKCVLKK